MIETKFAFLPSAGLNERRATRHVYVGSEIVHIPVRSGAPSVTGIAHNYRCEETGEIRRWGFDRDTTKQGVSR